MKKELKIKDVMVGDWVDVRNNAAQNTPHLEKITPSHFLRDEHWYGVELVAEILENNGFEKVLDEDGTECYRYYNSAADGYIKISLYNGGDGDWSIEIINYEKFDNNEIVYNNNFIFLKVHQLQHLFKLCGITKEIEL